MSEPQRPQGAYEFFDFEPATDDMASEVQRGLKSSPKVISPKFFYDARGSQLFEQITELDEYYLTRTEMSLFDAHLPEIAEVLGDNLCLIEYGSGSSKKIRKVLETVSPSAYVPVDISQDHLKENAWALYQDFPHLDVFPVCADITQQFALPEAVADRIKVGFFPGSSIGNFEPQLAQSFLRNVRAVLGAGGALIIGVDRKKTVSVLERAYNDADGVTAAFNLNLLAHLNARLEGNFDLGGFEHDARYNEAQGCIQMFLRSRAEQTVEIAGITVEFETSEELHTENSYKYHPEEFADLCATAGFQIDRQWSDPQDYFTLYLLRC